MVKNTQEEDWEPHEAVTPIPLLPEGEATRAAKALVADALAPGAPIQSLIRVDAILKASVDLRVAGLLEEASERSKTQGTPSIACRKGCYHCCCVSVSAFPFEVFAVVDHVRRRWGWLDRLKLGWRLRRYEKKGARRKANEPFPWCPFLVKGSCSIHSVRPTICRTHHSTDLAACIRDTRNRPASAEPFYAAMQPLYNGVYEGLGGSHKGLDLALGVRAALANPQALQDTTKGQDPFKDARTRERSLLR